MDGSCSAPCLRIFGSQGNSRLSPVSSSSLRNRLDRECSRCSDRVHHSKHQWGKWHSRQDIHQAFFRRSRSQDNTDNPATVMSSASR